MIKNQKWFELPSLSDIDNHNVKLMREYNYTFLNSTFNKTIESIVLLFISILLFSVHIKYKYLYMDQINSFDVFDLYFLGFLLISLSLIILKGLKEYGSLIELNNLLIKDLYINSENQKLKEFISFLNNRKNRDLKSCDVDIIEEILKAN